MIKNNFLKIVLAFFIFSMPMAVFALPADVGDPPGEDEPDPDAVPIDGGLSILLAAGVGYGVKKIHDRRKKNKGTTVDYSEK